ncbi:MAG: AAA family ATPase [Candidatus Gracilibacteria bacterium]|nr:AAA family ATPase [Candidatus Gracilibacteria bacterium]
MIELINKNLEYLKNYPIFQNNNKLIKDIVENLNKDKISIITGMRGLHKTSIIKEFIEKTGSQNYLYFNDELDSENKIKDDKDFFKLLDTYIDKYTFCNIIILQNINKIHNIKKLILDLYKKKVYKIIIVGNNIHIESLKELEIYNTIIKQNTNNLSDLLNFGTLIDINLINNNYYKNLFLDSIKNKVVLYDIITNYSIKSINLYNYTLTKISLINNNSSIRELHRLLKDDNVDISLITLMDYIDYSVNSKIIKRCFSYDLKLDKSINTKVKYYFTDIGIRNSFAGKKLDDNILIENIIYNYLISNYKEIYNGINGRFEFSFYIKDNSTCIHLSSETDKNEIQKEVNKLNKTDIPGDKYLILYNQSITNYQLIIDGVNVYSFDKYLDIITK